eukprot:425591-Pyramimonas_sp.AAC.1
MRELVHHANALRQQLTARYCTNPRTHDTTLTRCASALHTRTALMHYTHALCEGTKRQNHANARCGRAAPIHGASTTIIIRVVARFQGGASESPSQFSSHDAFQMRALKKP